MQGKNTYFPFVSINLRITGTVPMTVLTFITSFTGILHFTESIIFSLNGVNTNYALVPQRITVVQGY